ncbi:MAG TPA: branched-chain amino acid aminotransferase [Spirochaetota bacterium]|nr:branched-chain amino acid aminotransferase [Spirochaetota bacterium]HOM09114.1 branched-chain amino acid aminotransferase [Spirochaetota bacterium]HPP48937.1 branched-chain amino acid aminotransferase [Spirochaetota bacterium]
MQTQREKSKLDWQNLPFGYIKTDYNIRFYYKDGKWSEGELSTEETIPIHIAAPGLHYGQQAFEGLKVFETVDGRIVAFRPDENAKRMQRSCERIFIPEVPVDMFIKAVDTVVAANAKFVPPFGTGASLYVRPVIYGAGARVGLGPADEYVFIVFVTPVGPYYKGGFKPVKALVVEQYDRAAPNGVGDCKVGGNYAAGLRGGEYAKKKGFPIPLYLDPKEKKYVDEFGTSNFIAIKGNTYLTPESNSILPSITNKSLMDIATLLGMNVEKRPIAIDEVEHFDEVGAVGTAAVITPVCSIHYRDKVFTFCDEEKAGPTITKLYEYLTKLQTGEINDTFGWLHEITVK